MLSFTHVLYDYTFFFQVDSHRHYRIDNLSILHNNNI